MFEFLRGIHVRDKPRDMASVSNAPHFWFGTSASGKVITPKSSMRIAAVYACVRVLAETVAMIPLNVYERTDEGSKIADIPLEDILYNTPNSEMTSFTLRETMMTHLNLWGNSYIQILRNGAGKIVGLYPLLPQNMKVERDDETLKLKYTYTSINNVTTELTPGWDLMAIPGLGFDGVIGYSPIAMERNALGLAASSEEYGSSFFANGARPSGVLTHPSNVKDPSRLRENWEAVYSGSKNTGKTVILEEGMTYHQISIPNSEAQFLETRKFQVEEICRIFRIPPHMIGDLSHATFSNIEHQSIDFVVHSVSPWIVRIEQAMNMNLFTEQERRKYYVKFNLNGLQRGDYKARMEGYAIGRQNGWYSVNDIRELEEMNRIPTEAGGDAYMMNAAMIPISGTPNESGKEE